MAIKYNSTAYLVEDQAYPRVSYLLDVLNSGYGLQLYKIKRALEIIQGQPHLLDGEITFDLVKEITKLSEDEMMAAADRGTEVHEMLEKFVKGNGDLDDSLEAKGFSKWMTDNAPVYEDTELFLFSRRLAFAGTTDAVVKIGNERWLIDYKTSKRIYNKYELQLSAYAIAYEEMTGKKIDKIGVLHLGKNKRGFTFKELRRNDNIVVAAVRLFYWMNPNFRKNALKKLNEESIDTRN